MSDYRTAIIGVSGGRARGHAEAYAHIDGGRLVAVSSRDAEKVVEFGAEFGVPARYTDYREMMAREKPDLVHVNTPPDVRLEVFEAAAEAGVPALLVEKPLAIDGEDFAAMRDWASRAPSVKIAVNHQLHFQPRRALLQERVMDGAIGEVRFIDASAGLNLAYQGTHALQAIGAFHPAGVPHSVFAQLSGAEGLSATPRQHLAPDRCLASIDFDDGVTARLQCGPQAPRVGRDGMHTHKRIAVYGTRGFVHWWMWGWEMSVDGVVESGDDGGDVWLARRRQRRTSPVPGQFAARLQRRSGDLRQRSAARGGRSAMRAAVGSDPGVAHRARRRAGRTHLRDGDE